MSKSYREAVSFALSLGLVDDGIDGGGHHRFHNEETGEAQTLSTTMADTARAMANAKAALRRCAGADSRGLASREGEHRKRKGKRFAGSGFRMPFARDRTSPEAVPPRDLAAEREALMLRLLEIDEPTPEARHLAAQICRLDAALTRRT